MFLWNGEKAPTKAQIDALNNGRGDANAWLKLNYKTYYIILKFQPYKNKIF